MAMADFDDIDIGDLLAESNDFDIERFEFLDDSSWNELVEPHVAAGTARKLRFCEALFNTWRSERNSAHPNGTQVPEKPFVEFSVEELNT